MKNVTLSLNAPIEDLGLTKRTKNVLLSENIRTVGELLKLTDKELIYTPNCGRVTMREIREVRASLACNSEFSIASSAEEGTDKTFTYDEVKKFVCPYCAISMPDIFNANNAGSGVWTHYIPKTGNEFGCAASDFRANNGKSK